MSKARRSEITHEPHQPHDSLRTLPPASRQSEGRQNAAFGIHGASIGWEGALSLWRSANDLIEFAYHSRITAKRSSVRRRVEADEAVARRVRHKNLVTAELVTRIRREESVQGIHNKEGGRVTRIVPWTARDLIRRLDDVIRVYGLAMGYPDDLLATRRGIVASHVHRRGFRAVASLDEHGTLLGFGYGYHSEPGQWWHDQVRAAIPPQLRDAWLSDCFEVVELHVLPAAQGHGLGAAQLRALLRMASGKTTLLSTPEADEATSRAWRLYRRFGFVDVVRNFSFPGDARPFAILGRALPLDE